MEIFVSQAFSNYNYALNYTIKHKAFSFKKNFYRMMKEITNDTTLPK